MLKRKRLTAGMLALWMLAFGLLSGCAKEEKKESAAAGSEASAAAEAGTEEGKEKEEKAEASDTIVYGISTSPSGIFNPLLTDSIYDDAVCQMVYSSLLKLNKEQETEPYLAEKYEFSEDGRTLSFTLRDGLHWSDGEPLTAEDVVFTFTSLADKDYAGEYGSYISKVEGAEDYKNGKADSISGIKAADDRTVSISFEAPYGPALTNLGCIGIIPKHIWSKLSPAKWKEAKDVLQNPVGNGPYRLSSFSEGQEVRFEKNKDFFLGEPKTDKIIFKVLSEDTVTAELRNRDVDLAMVNNLKNADVEELTQQGFRIYRHPNNLFQYMGLNDRKPVFQDKRLREALITAIDRKDMVEQLLEGNGQVTNTPMLSSSWAYPKDVSLKDYPYDPERAKQLLSEAGYSMKDGVMSDASGNQLRFTLDVPLGNTIREQAAQIIQENLKAVGIVVELNKMEFPALMDKVVGNHDFDLYMMGNNLASDPDLTAYWGKAAISDVKGEMGWNISGFSTPELEKILADGAGSTDSAARKEAYKQFAVYMNEELPWIYLFEQDIMIAADQNLEGFDPSVFRDFSDAQNWVLYRSNGA